MPDKPFRNRLLVSNLVLLGMVIILFFLNFYSKTLFFRPSIVHQWRQTDCLSIAKNYYEEGMHFFSPKIHYQGPKDGKAVSEFPLLNYTAAALWKVFGEHEYIYRLLEYFIFILMIFVLFNTLAILYRSPLFGFIVASIVLTSPLLTYYGLNFIADVPAFSLGVISFCFGIRFYYERRERFFYLGLFVGALAVLLKASALMGLGIIVSVGVADLIGWNIFKTNNLFKRKIVPAVSILVCVLLIVAWYRFALAYNYDRSNNIFLLTVLPIWEMDEFEIIRNVKLLFNGLFPWFLNKPMLFAFCACVLFVIARFRQLDPFLRFAFLTTLIYFIAYLVFFFQVFSVHDYYLTNLMIFPVITFFSLGQILYKRKFFETEKPFLRIFLIVTFIFNGFHSAALYRLRTIEDDKMVYWFPFITREESELFKYLFWDYGNAIKKIEEFSPVLREHGIKRDELILSIPDQSFDISLYFMDQKGYTISREHFMLDSTVADRFIDMNLRYLVLSDTNLKTYPAFGHLAPHLEHFFTKKDVQVFKFKK